MFKRIFNTPENIMSDFYFNSQIILCCRVFFSLLFYCFQAVLRKHSLSLSIWYWIYLSLEHKYTPAFVKENTHKKNFKTENGNET